MSLCGSDQDKERLLQRLRRVEGQVRGLCSMIEHDRDCMEVLQQIASVSGALRGIWLQVVGDHLRGCVSQAVLEKDDKLVDELLQHLQKLR